MFIGQSHLNVNNNFLYHLNSSQTNIYTKNMVLVTCAPMINNKIKNHSDPIWSGNASLGIVNDNGEIIAQAYTIYGERHAMLLVPKQH